MSETERPVQQLQWLLLSGALHHVTYRNQGTVWEGLWFYRRSSDGFRGYEVAGCVSKNDPDYARAYEIVSGLGVHVGSYGHG